MSNVLALDGQWRYQTADSPDFAAADWDVAGWPSMAIPQNWFLGGLDHHGVVWFVRDFDLTLAPGEYATLRFEGVDYFADVTLNGRQLGHHEGYFEAFAFDVTECLRDGRNRLAVRVDSPFEPVGLDGWHMRKRLIKGVLNHHDCRPGGGWLPSGQAHNTGGIWNAVSLIAHGPITMDRLQLRADLDSDPPRLMGDLFMTNRAVPIQTTLRVTVTPDNFDGGVTYDADFELTVPLGTSRHAIRLTVPDVALWQPWDRGFPHLYRVAVADPHHGLEHSATFGFRTVSADDRYRWTINGRPYFIRGTNYIASQWLSETLFADIAHSEQHPFPPPDGTHVSGERWFERDVRLMRDANLNLVRVHAHVLPGEFHDVCDRAGILVWQDFPFQWGYRDDTAFHDEAERQARAMVEELYNHPSVIVWCMHNESPWDADWMAGEAGGSYDPAHNLALDERLTAAIRTLDPTRHVQLNSGTGDSHVYPGWYYGHWRDYAGADHGAPFPTEYGAQGLPAIETIRHIFARFGDDAGHAALVRFKAWIDTQPQWALAKDMPPLAEVPAELHDDYVVWQTWRFHDFQPPETFYLAQVDLGDSLAAFIANSQAYQNQIIQFATETYRQHKYNKINGVIQFMFVEPWPAITWAVLDYWRRPKPAYDVLTNAMQAVLVSAVIQPAIRAHADWSLDLLVVNDLLTAYPQAVAEWRLFDDNGELVADGNQAFAVPADGKSDAMAVDAPPLPAGDYRLDLTFRQGEEHLSQNRYRFKVYP